MQNDINLCATNNLGRINGKLLIEEIDHGFGTYMRSVMVIPERYAGDAEYEKWARKEMNLILKAKHYDSIPKETTRYAKR